MMCISQAYVCVARTCALVLVLLCGCGARGTQPDAMAPAPPDMLSADTGPADTGPPPAEACNGAEEWARVKVAYGNLVHVAGTGAGGSGANDNKWLPQFENTSATQAPLSRPHMAMADAAGNIFIADRSGHGVRMVTPAGIITTVAGTSMPGDDGDMSGPARERRLDNPNGLFVLPDGTVYIVDRSNSAIRKVTKGPDRQMSTLFRDPAGLGAGRGLYVEQDESEVFYAASDVVKRWTKRDNRIEDFARGPFVDLGMVVKDKRGRLLVGDRGSKAVYAVTREPGQPATIMRVTTTDLNQPRAVWPAFDTAGFFVGTHAGCQVFYVDCTGAAHLFLDGSGNTHNVGNNTPFDSPGPKINEVRSVALDAMGNVIVMEDDRGFVRMVKRR